MSQDHDPCNLDEYESLDEFLIRKKLAVLSSSAEKRREDAKRHIAELDSAIRALELAQAWSSNRLDPEFREMVACRRSNMDRERQALLTELHVLMLVEALAGSADMGIGEPARLVALDPGLVIK